jgi:hypothetical protein
MFGQRFRSPKKNNREVRCVSGKTFIGIILTEEVLHELSSVIEPVNSVAVGESGLPIGRGI